MGITGSALAENYVSSHVQSVISVINTTNQICNGNCINNVVVNVEVTDSNIGGDVYFGGTITQTCAIDTSCAVDAQSSTCLSTQLNQTIQQSADAITKGLLAGDSEANNITYLLTQLTNEIYNSYTQSCFSQSYQQTSYNATVEGSTVEGSVYFQPDIYQTSNLAVECTLSSATVNTVKQDLQTYVSQIATAKSVGAITPAVIIAIAICVTVLMIFFVKVPIGKLIAYIFLFLGIAVGIYFLTAWLANLPPFPPAPVACLPETETGEEGKCIYNPRPSLSVFDDGPPVYIVPIPITENCGIYGSWPCQEGVCCRNLNTAWIPCQFQNIDADNPQGHGYDALSERCYCPSGHIAPPGNPDPDTDYCICRNGETKQDNNGNIVCK